MRTQFGSEDKCLARFTCNIYMGVDGLLKLMVANRQCGIYVMDRSISRIYVGPIAFCSLSHLSALQFLFSQITILKTMGNTGNVMESHFSSQFLTIFTVFCFVLFDFWHNLLHIRYMFLLRCFIMVLWPAKFD